MRRRVLSESVDAAAATKEALVAAIAARCPAESRACREDGACKAVMVAFFEGFHSAGALASLPEAEQAAYAGGERALQAVLKATAAGAALDACINNA